MEEAASERCKAFAAAHRSDENRQAYITVSRRALSVTAMAKAEAWQTTCSSLSPESNPKFLYSLLRSASGSFSLSSFYHNFPSCSSPSESASVFGDYLRSHFSVSQPKVLRSRARSYLSELRRATCPEESHSSFYSPFSHAEFLAAASNHSSSTATGSDKVAYPMLKHLRCSDMDFLLHNFNVSWSLHSFFRSRKRLLLFPSTRWKSLSNLLLLSGLSFSIPASQSFLNASYYSVYFSFLNLILFSLSVRPVSSLDGLL